MSWEQLCPAHPQPALSASPFPTAPSQKRLQLKKPKQNPCGGHNKLHGGYKCSTAGDTRPPHDTQMDAHSRPGTAQGVWRSWVQVPFLPHAPHRDTRATCRSGPLDKSCFTSFMSTGRATLLRQGQTHTCLLDSSRQRVHSWRKEEEGKKKQQRGRNRERKGKFQIENRRQILSERNIQMQKGASKSGCPALGVTKPRGFTSNKQSLSLAKHLYS